VTEQETTGLKESGENATIRELEAVLKWMKGG